METESELTSSWSELTHECLINILSRLSLREIHVGPLLVCKSWHNASKDSFLHSKFDLESLFESTAESPRWWVPDFERKIDSLLRNVVVWSRGGLVEIRTRHCSDRSINLVADVCPNLHVLSIKSCPNVTDASMAQIAFRCTKIVELDISYCYKISRESLVMIGSNCPNLKVLKRNLTNWFDRSPQVGIVPDEYFNVFPHAVNSEAAAIGKYMPGLRYLELRSSMLSAKGLASICEGCLNLEYLDLPCCACFSSTDIRNFTSTLKNLKEIKISFFT